MKMIIAIVDADEVNNVNKALVKNKIKATRMVTQGAFLKGKNETFLIGLNDEKVSEAINVIEKSIVRRRSIVPTTIATDDGGFELVNKIDAKGGATIFVLEVGQFLKI